MQTLRNAKDIYKNGGSMAMDTGTTIPGPMPGRIMGALDEATRNAMQRAGITAEEAEKAVFQAPLTGTLGKALDSPIARYLIPFRRTPFNQFTEGLETLKPANLAAHPALSLGSFGAGAAHGAATSDTDYPVSIGVGAAGAAKYGLLYSGGAMAGRYLAGGNENSGAAGAAVPVSEYGIKSGLFDPTAPFTEPAGFKAWKRMFGE